MKQVYKAIDNIDNEMSYFYFDHENDRYTVLSGYLCDNDEDAINYFTKNEGDWSDVSSRFGDMNNPTLLKEW